jgi:hypothetical protein
MKRMALGQTAAILYGARPALEREWDYPLAATAIPANIKMIEGFLQSGPNDETLLELSAEIYTSYALVVLEDRLEQLDEYSDEAERLAGRAREMYLRSHRYGLRLIEVRRPGFRTAFEAGREPMTQALAQCDEEDTTALLWVALPLASAINLGRDDVALIALLPKVKAVMQRLLVLDEAFYHGAGHMVLGSMLGGVGEMLGGDPKQARKHFERALKLTRRRFLLVQVMYAKTLAVQLQDKALFKKLLDEVLAQPLERYPEQKLANVVAKRKARRLLARIDELF